MPGAAAGVVAGPEAVEDAVDVLGRDARPLVGDLEPPPVRSVGTGADGDAAARRAVPVGVVEQVGEHLGEAGRVRGDVQVARDVDDVDGAAPRDAGLGDGGLDELADVDGRQCERASARRRPR